MDDFLDPSLHRATDKTDHIVEGRDGTALGVGDLGRRRRWPHYIYANDLQDGIPQRIDLDPFPPRGAGD